MIPIRDTLRSKNYPIVNGTLIGLNVLVFSIELLQGRNLEPFIYTVIFTSPPRRLGWAGASW
jgi:hypothetical protein